MSSRPRILAFSGSIRRESWNLKLLDATVPMLEQHGAQVKHISLANYPMPLYNGDIEVGQGLPEAAHELKTLMADHDGFLIATPEYNGFFTPLLKNTIDWVSRRAGEEPPLMAFKGKTAALISASPGPLGGIRGLLPTRQLLSGVGLMVIPEQFALKSASKAFGEDGQLVDEAAASFLQNLTKRLTHVTACLSDQGVSQSETSG